MAIDWLIVNKFVLISWSKVPNHPPQQEGFPMKRRFLGVRIQQKEMKLTRCRLQIGCYWCPDYKSGRAM
jgi:hypothetical protein